MKDKEEISVTLRREQWEWLENYVMSGSTEPKKFILPQFISQQMAEDANKISDILQIIRKESK